jgi:ADP-heptose:LPS heptosyltransferase
MGESLAIHPGALGDVLLAVPALRALRRAHPGDGVALAAQPRIGALLVELGVVDRALDVEALGLGALFAGEAAGDRETGAGREGGAGDGVSRSDGRARGLRAVAEAARVVCWFGARDAGFVRALTALARAAVVDAPHAADRVTWEHLCSAVSGAGAADRSPLRVPVPVSARGGEALRAAGWDGAGPLVMLHPGAGSPGKCWAADGFAAVGRAVADASPAALVVHQGPADRDAAKALLARLPDALLLAEPALPVLAGALAHVRAWVGNDSGVSHLAAAVGVPAAVLFTAPMLRWRPWRPDVAVHVVEPTAVDPATVEAVVAAVLGAVDEREGRHAPDADRRVTAGRTVADAP